MNEPDVTECNRLLQDIDTIRIWTLRGGNDPDEPGSDSNAIDETLILMSRIIKLIQPKAGLIRA